MEPLPRTDLAAAHVDPKSVVDFIRAAQIRELGLHSLMIVRSGAVALEAWWRPYGRTMRQTVHSVSKSFTSTAVGIAEDEGLLSVDEPVLSFFPSYASPRVQKAAGEVRLRDLLSMSTGHETDTMHLMRSQPDEDWVRIFFDTPFAYPPGTHFLYNSGASYLLSLAVISRTGQGLVEYLTPRLFDPLGMDVPPWALSPRGHELGGSGMRLLTEDLAKLGQLYLRRGDWNGNRLLSEAWVKKATSQQVANHSPAPDWASGYGFQFWRSRHNSFRADGAFGQFSFVLPDHDVVIALTAGTPNNTVIAQTVWDFLLPGLDAQDTADAGSARGDLDALLPSLSVGRPAGRATNADHEARLDGRALRLRFNTLGVRSVRLLFEADDVVFERVDAAGEVERLRAGRRDWVGGTSKFWVGAELVPPVKVSLSAAWTSETCLEIYEQYVESACRRTWRFSFHPGDRVTVTTEMDLPFWTPHREEFEVEIADR